MGILTMARQRRPVIGLEVDSYTGLYESNAIDGTIKFLTGGVLKVRNSVSIDAFLVGGGGAGRYGGGGGGYTKTARKIQLIAGQEYEIVIGEGGVGSKTETGYSEDGKKTTAFGYEAAGGIAAGKFTDAQTKLRGGAGGSGGGGGANTTYGKGEGGDGGTNGRNGANKGTSGGAGQGYTTRAFGEEYGKLYAGGGGGCPAKSTETPGAAGEGGGGPGAFLSTVNTSGEANTGGGGGGTYYVTSRTANGGSGVVIIRPAKAVGRQYLYSAGDEHTGLTMGWVGNNKKSNRRSGATAHAPTIDRTNADYIVADTQTGGYGGMFITSNKIELEHYKEIVFEGEITAVDGVAQNIYAGAWETIGDYYQQNPTKFVGSNMEETLTRIVVDVSDINVPCFIGLGLTRTKAKLTACYLIPKD